MADKELPTVGPDTPSHADNGDFLGRGRFADTSRHDASTRETKAQASFTINFGAQSMEAVEGGCDEMPDPFGMGGSVKVVRPPNPWGINAPVGGQPSPYAGSPRQ